MSKNAFAAAILGAGLWWSGAPVFAGEAEWEAHMGAGVAAYQRGDYRIAIDRFEDALKEAQAFDEGDPRLATTLNNLTELYLSQGRFADAEPLFRRSLAIREKALGAEHPDVAISLENISALYSKMGKTGEAKQLTDRAARIRALKR